MQRDFHPNRSSAKFKKLKVKFKRMKRKAISTFHSNFVSDLKSTNPGKWYAMAKNIGSVDQMSGD